MQETEIRRPSKPTPQIFKVYFLLIESITHVYNYDQCVEKKSLLPSLTQPYEQQGTCGTRYFHAFEFSEEAGCVRR